MIQYIDQEGSTGLQYLSEFSRQCGEEYGNLQSLSEMKSTKLISANQSNSSHENWI